MEDDRRTSGDQQSEVEASVGRAKRGAILAGAGRLMGLLALALLGWIEAAPDDTTSLFLIPTLALFFTALWFYERGKRMQSVPAQVRMTLDSRPPVVYLRSFKDDKVARVRPLTNLLSVSAVFLGVPTEEEQLTEAMNEIGPFVAIGKPGENLPELGASRLYVGEDEWQNRISALMSRAQLVVLRAGDTPGFWWELQHAARHARPEKLLVLLPFKQDEYWRFCKRADGVLPCALPEFEGGRPLIGSRLRAMLHFDRDWTPHIQKLAVPLTLSLAPLVIGLKKALRPVVERLPSDAKRAPIRHRRGLALLRTIPAVFLILFGTRAIGAAANGAYRAIAAVAHNDRGFALYEHGNFDGAIREYEQAIRLHPELVNAHNNLGLAWYRKGDLDRALTIYGAALRLDPNLALLRNNIGLALLDKGDRKRAIEEFQSALRIDPTTALAHGNLCAALSRENNIDDTAAACREAIRVNPQAVDAHYFLGNAVRLQGDLAGAVGHYRDALRLNPNFAPAHNNLGWTLTKMGNIEEGMREYREAIRLAPDSPEAHLNLGEALAATGDWTGAASGFRTTIQLLPNLAVAHYNLAIALSRRGDNRGARLALTRAYELAPDDPNIRRDYQQITRR